MTQRDYLTVEDHEAVAEYVGRFQNPHQIIPL